MQYSCPRYSVVSVKSLVLAVRVREYYRVEMQHPVAEQERHDGARRDDIADRRGHDPAGGAAALEFAAAVDQHRVHTGRANQQTIGLADIDRVDMQRWIESRSDAGCAIDHREGKG